jgi:hypothetical protein
MSLADKQVLALRSGGDRRQGKRRSHAPNLYTLSGGRALADDAGARHSISRGVRVVTASVPSAAKGRRSQALDRRQPTAAAGSQAAPRCRTSVGDVIARDRRRAR